MRPTSTRHQQASASRHRSSHKTVYVVAAVSVVGVAMACADERRSIASSDSMASPVAPAAPAPPGLGVGNEGGRSSLARTRAVSAQFSKVKDEKQLAADQFAPASAEGSSSTGPGMPSASAVTPPSITGAMIIRAGTSVIEVDSLDTAIARIRTLALRVNGFIANTTVQGGRDQLRTASLELKIPSERFDDALTGLSPIGKVESVNVNAEDVGEEYVDIAARVENAHRLEGRIIELLANRTGKLQDVLSVEHELARVREEIERYEGRMRFLRTRAAMSTLTLTVHEHAPVIVPVAGDGPILVAFREAWRSFVSLVASFIASLGVLIPLGLVLLLGALGVKRWIVPVLTPQTPRPTNVVEVSGD